MSTVAERQAAPTVVASERADAFADLVVHIVRLAGNDLPFERLEPAALVLCREGVLDCDGVTFGCDYELNVRSHELRRGYIRALDAGLVHLSDHRLSAQADDEFAEHDDLALAAEVFSLPGEELARRARSLLLSE